MSVVLSSTVKTAQAADSVPISHPRIGMEDWYSALTSTVIASTEDTDFPRTNAIDGLDWDYWKPTSLPAWIKVDPGGAKTVTYMGVAAHNLSSKGVTVTPQYSLDNSTWTDAATGTVPQDDGPVFFLFDAIEARYWRLYLSGGSIPQVGVVQVGRALAFERALWQGHTPITLARQTDIRPNRAEGGARLGRSIIRRGNATGFEVDNLSASWVRNSLDDFIKEARTRAFFLAWNPGDWPNEVGWGWCNDDIQPRQTGPRDLMSVSFNFVGVAQGDV